MPVLASYSYPVVLIGAQVTMEVPTLEEISSEIVLKHMDLDAIFSLGKLNEMVGLASGGKATVLSAATAASGWRIALFLEGRILTSNTFFSMYTS